MTQSGSRSMIPEDIKASTPSSAEVALENLQKREHHMSRTPSHDAVPQRSSSVRSGRGIKLENQAKNDEENEKSRGNPLKKIFGRSKSHHLTHNKTSPQLPMSVGEIKQKLSLKSENRSRTRGASLLHKDSGSVHIIKSSSAIPSLASHNTNPFATSQNGRIPLESLNIPPRPPSINHIYHSPSSASATPSSTSLGFYQTEGDSKGENILPLPLKNPNDLLPENLQQPSVMLTDNFGFVDSGRKTLGEGGSSQVMTVYSLYRKKNVYALKRFKLFKGETPDEFYERCVTEFLIAKKLSDHINIIKTFYLMKTPSISNGPKRGWAFLMQKGVQDMYHFTTTSGWAAKPFEEKWCCFKQICRGVRHMHSLGIAHRDIKLENVLVTDYGAMKITDFGISTYGIADPEDPTSERIKLKGYCGSPPHVPPEVMILSVKKKKIIPVPKDKEEYDPFLMDTWALGILMFNLVTPLMLFSEAHKDDSKFRHFLAFYDQFVKHSPHFKKPGVYRSGPGAEHPDFSKLGNVDASRVCLRLLDPDPESRYTIEDLFEDPWMQKVETCLAEDAEEPIKQPDLRKTSSDDEMVPHDIPSSGSSFAEDAVTSSPSTNPFFEHSVKSPKIKSKSMLSIAEEGNKKHDRLLNSAGESSIENLNISHLPTLNEEKSNDRSQTGDAQQLCELSANESEAKQEISENEEDSSREPSLMISSLSLDSSNNEPGSTNNKDTPLPLQTNTGVSYPSIASPTLRSPPSASWSNNVPSNRSTTPLNNKKRKNVIHHHHECSGKSVLLPLR